MRWPAPRRRHALARMAGRATGRTLRPLRRRLLSGGESGQGVAVDEVPGNVLLLDHARATVGERQRLRVTDGAEPDQPPAHDRGLVAARVSGEVLVAFDHVAATTRGARSLLPEPDVPAAAAPDLDPVIDGPTLEEVALAARWASGFARRGSHHPLSVFSEVVGVNGGRRLAPLLTERSLLTLTQG